MQTGDDRQRLDDGAPLERRVFDVADDCVEEVRLRLTVLSIEQVLELSSIGVSVEHEESVVIFTLVDLIRQHELRQEVQVRQAWKLTRMLVDERRALVDVEFGSDDIVDVRHFGEEYLIVVEYQGIRLFDPLHVYNGCLPVVLMLLLYRYLSLIHI